MKKIILSISAIFVIAVSMSSCCKTCSKTGQNSVQVCRNNYNTEEDYNNAAAYYTLAGYSCN